MPTTPTTPIAARRRPFILEPGEHLLLEVDPIRVMVNFGRTVEETGISPKSLTSCRLAALPLPKGSARSWPGVRPEMLWLPLLWLPPHLAEPKCFVVEDGLARSVPSSMKDAAGVSVESDEEWVLRVCLELTAAGFYDPDSGTFLDVMDYIGIDVDTLDGQMRVAAWLGGSSDDDLDLLATGLELESNIKSSTDPDWGLNEALANHGNFVNCVYAYGSESLVDSLVELKTALGAGQATFDNARSLVETVCMAAATWMEDIPLQDEDGDEDSEGLWWFDRQVAVQRFTGSLDELVADYLDPAIERLSEIRDAAMPLAERYLGEADRVVN